MSLVVNSGYVKNGLWCEHVVHLLVTPHLEIIGGREPSCRDMGNGDEGVAGNRVTPGFASSNRIVLNKDITVRSVNGPAVTIIQGEDNGINYRSVRCAYLSAGIQWPAHRTPYHAQVIFHVVISKKRVDITALFNNVKLDIGHVLASLKQKPHRPTTGIHQWCMFQSLDTFSGRLLANSQPAV